jgi:hypothetical protein
MSKKSNSQIECVNIIISITQKSIVCSLAEESLKLVSQKYIGV